MGKLLQIANELAALCGRFASAVVKFVPDYRLGEADEAPKIYVVPVNARRAIETRADSDIVYTYEVGMVRWVSSDADVEACVSALDSIAEALLGEQLNEAFVSEVETKLLYSVEAVSRRKQYVGVLSVDVRDLS